MDPDKKTTTLVGDHEYFIPTKFHENLFSGSGEEVENVEKFTTEDGRRTVRYDNSSLELCSAFDHKEKQPTRRPGESTHPVARHPPSLQNLGPTKVRDVITDRIKRKSYKERLPKRRPWGSNILIPRDRELKEKRARSPHRHFVAQSVQQIFTVSTGGEEEMAVSPSHRKILSLSRSKP
ncbi:hypothetical protein FSP39_022078 [Pinctada imbricata]|uniref:Uncharacterized protein n=1 Tax=Pinctada imbricata TaxID=66713 RepID=A0AA89BVA7_PINIB|nr:hypothetical protein FSP39_022078 [Pinctada imbricata]